MDNQKDTQKTGLNSYGQSNVHNFNTLSNMTNPRSHSVFEFASRKTEKLVTALYMVTDCMETEDALKGKLRQIGVELLSDMFKLSALPSIEKSTYLLISISRVQELLSFIEIACAIGYISQMNTIILKKEFSVLITDLENQTSRDKHFSFTLNEEMFNLAQNNNPEKDSLLKNNLTNIPRNSPNFIKDNMMVKRTNNNDMSFTNRSQFLSSQKQVPAKNYVSNVSDKIDRSDKILSIIRDKQNSSPTGEQGISIKDISLSFTDCSEKTIQRELNSLVARNKLKKFGAKRWSKYSLIN